MFYRPGGADNRINAQYDSVFTDQVDGATGWLPVVKGNTIAVNIASAIIEFQSAVASKVIKSAFAPEAQIVLELKMQGGDADNEVWPIDLWQNLLVATSRRSHAFGWVRLRVLNINNTANKGVAMALQIARTGDVGAVT